MSLALTTHDRLSIGGLTSSAAPARVHFENVSHLYNGRGGRIQALHEINLEIEAGEFVCLVGSSGCGKTTLLRMLAGFLTPSHGAVTVDGRKVTRPGADRGVVFQQPTLYPWLSVRGNVELGPRLQGSARAERDKIVNSHLELVGLAAFAEHAPYELSGGMQQRAAIARTLAGNPSIVLMDEPFGALDALTRERLQSELRAIWKATGKTFLFITHSVEEAVYLGTRVVVLSPRPGRIVLDERLDFARDANDLRLTPAFTQKRATVSAAIRQPQEAS